MPRLAFVVSLVCGCGGYGSDGSGAGSTKIVGLGDGVDVPNGTDPGGGTERAGGRDFRSCVRDPECLGGVCLAPSTDGPGACAMVCFASPGLAFDRSFTAQPCDRGDACVVSGGLGLCLRPCVTVDVCPRVSGLKFVCGAVSGLEGKWCR